MAKLGRAHTASSSHHADRGASSVEYALLIALIAAFIVGAVSMFGLSVVDLFDFSLPGGS